MAIDRHGLFSCTKSAGSQAIFRNWQPIIMRCCLSRLGSLRGDVDVDGLRYAAAVISLLSPPTTWEWWREMGGINLHVPKGFRHRQAVGYCVSSRNFSPPYPRPSLFFVSLSCLSIAVLFFHCLLSPPRVSPHLALSHLPISLLQLSLPYPWQLMHMSSGDTRTTTKEETSHGHTHTPPSLSHDTVDPSRGGKWEYASATGGAGIV